MNEKQMKRWEWIRRPGKKHFIWVRCVLGWGVLTAVLYSIITSILNMQAFFTILPIAVIVFPIGGIFIGSWAWNITEKKYKRAMRNKSKITVGVDIPA
ncbi:MAG: hypothetical protein KAJ66_04470 [Candidatus Omnitrophica bacterium]|nr:hypothetical protein [Candidatus Omnitrophota bacterium]